MCLQLPPALANRLRSLARAKGQQPSDKVPLRSIGFGFSKAFSCFFSSLVVAPFSSFFKPFGLGVAKTFAVGTCFDLFATSSLRVLSTLTLKDERSIKCEMFYDYIIYIYCRFIRESGDLLEVRKASPFLRVFGLGVTLFTVLLGAICFKLLHVLCRTKT